MSAHNIDFQREIRKICGFSSGQSGLSQTRLVTRATLISLTVYHSVSTFRHVIR